MKKNKETKVAKKGADVKEKKGLFKKNTPVSDGIHIPKTVQESIPYIRVFENGIIEPEKGRYSKTYLLEDVNFQIASQEEQENIFLAYSDLLNTFGTDVDIQISINNRNIDAAEFQKKVLINPQDDNLNYLREEYNQMLINKMQEGRNNIVREKYITLSIAAPSIEEAVAKFATLDSQLNDAIKKITQQPTEPMSAIERLSVIHDLYNPGLEESFYRKAQINKKEVESFNFDHMIDMGICTKDLVGPDSLEFASNYIKIGDKYARVCFLDNLPNFLTTNILNDFTETPCNMLISVFFSHLHRISHLNLLEIR